MKNFIILLSLLTLLSGCVTKVPFTHQMRSEFDLGPAELKRIQYYLSDTVVFQRELRSQETVTINRGVKVRRESSIEQVKIRRHTPGVAVATGPHRLDISFEHGNQITFGIDTKINRRVDGVYEIMIPTREGGRENLTYGGMSYTTTHGLGEIYLLVNLQELEKFRKISRTVKGRRL